MAGRGRRTFRLKILGLFIARLTNTRKEPAADARDHGLLYEAPRRKSTGEGKTTATGARSLEVGAIPAWLVDAEEVETEKPLPCDLCGRQVKRFRVIEFPTSEGVWLICARCYRAAEISYGLREVDGTPTDTPASKA